MKTQLNLIEQSMRNDAVQVLSHYERMKVINPQAAARALNGIIQYITEPLTTEAINADAKDNFNLGLITKEELENKLR